MKILFVVEHFYPYTGGAEELFLNLTSSLASKGHDVHVVTTLHDDSLKRSEEYCGIKITRIKCYNRFLFTFLSLPAIFRLAKNAGFIHTTSYNSALPSFIAGTICRKKVVITFHEVWGKMWFTLPYTSRVQLTAFYLYEWFILKLPFYKYIAVSDSTRKALIKNNIPENKIVKIYNGIDYSRTAGFKHSLPDKFTFCFFGRLGISKGIDILLEATKMFVENHPDAILKLIIPTYPEKIYKKVMHSVEKLNLKNNSIILHNLSKDDLFQEVAKSSCVIIPSHSEGFCFVAVEAMAMNVPVISSGKGSLAEVVGGEHLVLNNLSKEEINLSLEKAIRNEWSFKPPEKFPLRESIENYLRLYNEITD